MKSPSIFAVFFVLFVPFLAFGQQPQRISTEQQALELHRGRLADLENYTTRFETAYLENDLESLGDIQMELVKIMRDEIKASIKAQKGAEENRRAAARIQIQKWLIQNFPFDKLFTEKDNPQKEKTPPFLSMLYSFRYEMQENIKDLEADLNPNQHRE